MRNAVKIKSFPNGIALYLNAELPFDRLLEEIGYKFSDARNFFGSATMVLSIEGRQVDDMEELRILDVIRENSDLNIACIAGRDDNVNKNYIRALAQTEEEVSPQQTDGQFFKGDLSREYCNQRQKYYYPRRPARQGICRRKRQGRSICSSV